VIKENYSLRKLNTFGLDVSSRYFFESQTTDQLFSFIGDRNLENESFFLCGEGSNILYTGNFNGLIIHPAMKGIEVMEEDDQEVVVKAFSGENWDNFVRYTVEKNWGGLENLSLIPGSVGACPVQNIGAYGVEVKDRIIKVEGINIADKSWKTIVNKDCRFDYRNSIFKHELKNQFIITSVTFRLDKAPRYHLSYGLVEKEFFKKPEQNLAALRKTIIEIRESKLPDPKKYGNAGSFFKNPVIRKGLFEELQRQFAEIPFYPAGDDKIKIPAAWLIEKAGWRGKREGNVGCFPTQPLVIVNYGGATGNEILEFSIKVMDSVRKIFGIDLQREVNVI
jgi:UDP-N-acetylmuramate dehydrogenase